MISSISSVLFAALAFSATASTAAIPQACGPALNAGPITTVARLENDTWLENLALRSDGSILATQYLPHGRLVLASPATRPGSVQTVHNFSSPNIGVAGIVELEPDVFYFATVQTGSSTPGTGQVWRINMTQYAGPDRQTPVSLVANLSGSVLPNGVTTSPDGTKILVADSQRGAVFRVDPASGASDVVASGAALRNTTATGFGVNGIHPGGDGYLYYTNTDLKVFGRFPISPDGTKMGSFEVLTSNGDLFGVDDFAFYGTDGTLLAGDLSDSPSTGNKILYIPRIGQNCTIDVTKITGPTAVQISRPKQGPAVVFVSTHGALSSQGQIVGPATLSSFTLGVPSRTELELM